MAKAKPRTMAGKRAKAAKVMREFHAGPLHHGGSGEIVHAEDVAKAIAMNSSGLSRKKKKS